MRGAMLEGLGYLASANAEIACVVMIETRQGLDNVASIAATPGIDALFIGPVDLCYGLGLAPGSFPDRKFGSAVRQIRAACDSAGYAAGIFGYTPELARESLAQGFNFALAGY
jgi:4-hydroxy-2-oxoheptanedioate aldolase